MGRLFGGVLLILLGFALLVGLPVTNRPLLLIGILQLLSVPTMLPGLGILLWPTEQGEQGEQGE
jgi:hypothetical protein